MDGEQASLMPLVFVSTGTDKRFPFVRLIRWVESWAELHPEKASVLVQAGITPSEVLPSVREYHPEEMSRVLARSHAAVLQGGPGGIMKARANGVLPILVPRQGRLGEAVDDHQVEFGRWAAQRGLTVTVETQESLHAALDVVLEDRLTYSIPPESSPAQQTAERIGARIDRLLDGNPSRSKPSRARRVLGSGARISEDTDGRAW